MTDKQLFKKKNEYMSDRFQEVTPVEFYRGIFPEGSFERKGIPDDQKANGIYTVIGEEISKNHLVFDDLNAIDDVKGEEFAVMSPIGYSGRRRIAKNGRWLYALAIDLDGVEMDNLNDVFFQAKNGIIPLPTYTVNSGHGLHLYYVFDEPLPLYYKSQNALRLWKYELTAKVWNGYTSTYTKREQVQYQGIFQGFRMPGTQSKLGKNYIVTAFKTGENVTYEYLNQFLMDKTKALTADVFAPSKGGKKNEYTKSRWHVNPALYNWWIEKIKEGATVGHRYSCLTVLASYGIKCDIPREQVLSDAMELLPFLEEMTEKNDNHFTERDVKDAMKLYDENYITYPRHEVEKVSGISVPPNKRNGRKQKVHLERARAVQKIDYPNNEWQNKEGRPVGSGTKKSVVYDYLGKNPGAKKVDVIKNTGLSKPTVYKYFDEYMGENNG